ncbi:hypothetical protein MVEN_02500200 [Mycena venus]|uniref:Uncharacterized protein n=1 Tax=Mycena venus TaxID=2733690 RepID=A0A8H6U3W5_9AGAR|nr:hypothetical protein MVEN_02500200 [Mycena venus]
MVSMFFYTYEEGSGSGLTICALFTVVDVLAWLLWITIFAAAFVMYRGSLVIPEDVKSASPGMAQATLSGT